MNKEIIVNFLRTKQKATPWGKRNIVIHIRQFCLFLRRRGFGNYSPNHELLPKLQYKIQYVPVSNQDVINLMKEARKSRPRVPMGGETIAVMIGLCWCTGLRRRELINLQHRDIDLKDKTILVRLSKFRKSRVVPISDSTMSVLQKFIKEKQGYGLGTGDDNFVFPSQMGRRLSPNIFADIFRSCAKKLNIKSSEGAYATPHDLRHNFATRTLKSLYLKPKELPPQVYLPILSTFLGHADVGYSQFYLHPDFSLLEMAGQKMEKNFRGKKREKK
jgi:integrase/recombinase XerD